MEQPRDQGRLMSLCLQGKGKGEQKTGIGGSKGNGNADPQTKRAIANWVIDELVCSVQLGVELDSSLALSTLLQKLKSLLVMICDYL